MSRRTDTRPRWRRRLPEIVFEAAPHHHVEPGRGDRSRRERLVECIPVDRGAAAR